MVNNYVMPSEIIRKTVLFLCTGNYYRSRFAELLFNHLASQNKLEWIAISRGLALERGAHNIGPISKDTVEALAERGVRLRRTYATRFLSRKTIWPSQAISLRSSRMSICRCSNENFRAGLKGSSSGVCMTPIFPCHGRL